MAVLVLTGVPVAVTVLVGVLVAVLLGVAVGVAVKTLVGESVGVRLGRTVRVTVAVAVQKKKSGPAPSGSRPLVAPPVGDAACAGGNVIVSATTSINSVARN